MDAIKLIAILILAVALVIMIAAFAGMVTFSTEAHSAFSSFFDDARPMTPSISSTPLHTPTSVVRALLVDGVIGTTRWTVIVTALLSLVGVYSAWLLFRLIRWVIA